MARTAPKKRAAPDTTDYTYVGYDPTDLNTRMNAAKGQGRGISPGANKAAAQGSGFGNPFVQIPQMFNKVFGKKQKGVK